MENERELKIATEYVRLSDALKLSDLAETGGQAKMAIQDGEVRVDGAVVTERGRKIRPGMRVGWRGRTVIVVGGIK